MLYTSLFKLYQHMHGQDHCRQFHLDLPSLPAVTGDQARRFHCKSLLWDDSLPPNALLQCISMSFPNYRARVSTCALLCRSAAACRILVTYQSKTTVCVTATVAVIDARPGSRTQSARWLCQLATHILGRQSCDMQPATSDHVQVQENCSLVSEVLVLLLEDLHHSVC